MRASIAILASVMFGTAVTPWVPSAESPWQATKLSPQTRTGARPTEGSVVGTIEKFEESVRRLVITTKDGHVTFVLAADAVVRLGSRTLAPAALDAHRGRRAKVRFTQLGASRTAHWIVISSDPPKAYTNAHQ